MMFASAFVIQKPFFWGVPEQCTLAAALEVSPAALLMPPASFPFEAVELPGGVTGTASNGESSPQPQIRDPAMLLSGVYLLTF